MVDGKYPGQEKALRIKELLDSKGIKSFFDREDMSRNAGTPSSIIVAMGERIREASAVIICASESYDKRPNCVRELEYAMLYQINPNDPSPQPPPYGKHILLVNCGDHAKPAVPASDDSAAKDAVPAFNPQTSSILLGMYMGSKQWFPNQTKKDFDGPEGGGIKLWEALKGCPAIKALDMHTPTDSPIVHRSLETALDGAH